MNLPPFRPILSALRRSPMMPWLLAAQVAIACAILSNAVFLLQRQAAPLLVDDGIDGERLLLVDQLVSRNGMWDAARIEAGRQALRAVPGVEAIAPALGLPMKQSMVFNMGLHSPNGATATASGFTGMGLREALGVELVQGRDFTPEEGATIDLAGDGVDIQSGTPVILTQALARHFFPDGDALGGKLEQTSGDKHLVVVGIVRHLMRYELGQLEDGKAEFSLLMPARIVSTPVLNFAVRADPARLEEVKAAITTALEREFGSALMPGITPRVDRYEDLRREAFKPRRAAIWLLGSVIAVVLAVTGIGIAGLSGYWVEQRLRGIGIRRALGATRGDMLRHFLAENLLVVGAGLIPGLIAAYAINQWLMQHYALPRLPWHYLPMGAVALWGIGQIAVFNPAWRAAGVPPAIATRSA